MSILNGFLSAECTMDYINDFLSVWGLISLIGCLFGFLNDSTEISNDVVVIDNPSDERLRGLSLYHDYPQSTESYEKTLLISVGQPVQNIQVYTYNTEKERWQIAPQPVCKGLLPNQGILFHIDRPEGHAFYKIKWSIHFGAAAEYVFSYNGFSGVHSQEYFVYHYSFLSKLRKLLHLK